MNEEEQILTFVKNCSSLDWHTGDKELSRKERDRFNDFKLRFKTGEPLQYVLGLCCFMNLNFKVNEHVLIPRPETELLVDFILKYVRKRKNEFFDILDVGTGCGNIALSVKMNVPNCSMTALDISEEALYVARENAKRMGLQDNIVFIKSDMFRMLDDKKKFDIIVANPPYIPSSFLNQLPQDVRQEPFLALDGGIDGLGFYRRLARETKGYLNKKGFLCVEIGDGQSHDIIKIFEKKEEWNVVGSIKDYTKTERILIAKTRG